VDSDHVLLSDTLVQKKLCDFLPFVTLQLKNRAVFLIHDYASVAIQALNGGNRVILKNIPS
jgi:hypothetical protein